jgi:hypothetical protein
MTIRDQEEQDLRIDHMTINIEIREDMEQFKRDQVDRKDDLKWEFRKIVIQTALGAAAAVGTGLGIAFLLWGLREPLSPPPPQTIILQQPAPAPAPLKPP